MDLLGGGGCRGYTPLLALARWGAGVQFFIRQKNISDIMKYTLYTTVICNEYFEMQKFEIQ